MEADMKSRLPVVACCLLTTLLIGIWLGQSLLSEREVHEEIVERSTVSPFNSDGWQLASGQEFGPSATLRTESPFERSPFSNHPGSGPFGSEPVEPSETPVGPDVAYFPEVITEAAGATDSLSFAPVRKAHSEEPSPATLSDEDAAVWNAELKDLPADQADDILRLRQQLGSVASESLGLSFPEMPAVANVDPPGLFPELAAGDARPIPLNLPSDTESQVVRAAATKKLSARNRLLAEAESVVAENMANAKTPGYKRRQIVLLNVPDSDPLLPEPDENGLGQDGVETVSADDAPGTKIATVQWLNRLDLRQGELTPTANPRDIALAGQGWLQIKHGDQAEFVRTGMLGFDNEGRLGIRTGAGLLPIVPELKLPVSEQRLLIAESGDVYADTPDGSEKLVARLTAFDFRDASALKRTSAGTYAATSESGPPLKLRPDSSRFLQAVLEASNVNRDSELAELIHLKEIVE
jgi:flagellar basal body rod protein FlgG